VLAIQNVSVMVPTLSPGRGRWRVLPPSEATIRAYLAGLEHLISTLADVAQAREPVPRLGEQLR
jgi:hypothetical protein